MNLEQDRGNTQQRAESLIQQHRESKTIADKDEIRFQTWNHYLLSPRCLSDIWGHAYDRICMAEDMDRTD
jgi:hypothetical protein